jgi:predicted amidohydrolase
VATGARDGKPARSSTIEQNVQYYGALCRQACRDVRPDLIVLPEIALQYGLRRSPLETAVPAPGRETQPFQQIARSGRCRIALGMLERDGDAVYNSVALISPRGRVDGRYRKVHLAVGQEIHSGIRGGDGFPVFDTEAGRIGVNICMDSSAAESSRMAGLNGADILLLPIMGDHRAWFTFERRFDVDRWRCIMRTRAMDNQFCLAVARNAAEGSCIINRIGDILAWNDGTRDFIHAVVPLDEDLPTCNNGCYADVNWMQRRVCAYAGAEDPWRLGRVALP